MDELFAFNEAEPVYEAPVAEGDDVEAEPEIRTEPAPVPDILPLSPRQAVKAAAALEWVLRVEAFMMYVPPVLYKHASDEHAAGSVRYPAKEFLVIVVGARHPDPRAGLGFRAVYHDGSYQEAEVADPVGILRELRYDYTPSANELKRVKDEPEWAHKARVERMEIIAGQQEYDYNDGAQIKHKRAAMKNATEFKTWLKDWQALLVKPVEKPKRARKTKEKEAA